VRDVSERHAAQEALREREHHFRMLADNISQLTWVADAQGNRSGSTSAGTISPD
jgi:PAS domain-containing protein